MSNHYKAIHEAYTAYINSRKFIVAIPVRNTWWKSVL